MQGLGIMHGTYDPNDVFAYILAISVGCAYVYVVDKLGFKNVNRVGRRRTSSLKLFLTMLTFALFVLIAIGSDDTVGRISANTGWSFEKIDAWRRWIPYVFFLDLLGDVWGFLNDFIIKKI